MATKKNLFLNQCQFLLGNVKPIQKGGKYESVEMTNQCQFLLGNVKRSAGKDNSSAQKKCQFLLGNVKQKNVTNNTQKHRRKKKCVNSSQVM